MLSRGACADSLNDPPSLARSYAFKVLSLREGILDVWTLCAERICRKKLTPQDAVRLRPLIGDSMTHIAYGIKLNNHISILKNFGLRLRIQYKRSVQ